MALRNLLVCINSSGGKNDLPCLVLHSPSRETSLNAARSVLAALRPCGPSRTERHILPAVDPGRHATYFDFERAPTSLMIDLSQSEVARTVAVDWVAPIACTRHVQGERRSIVMHCADLLSWAHQNALKKVIESSHTNTLFILTTSQATALQSAILSRGVVIRCPVAHMHANATGVRSANLNLYVSMEACMAKTLTFRSPQAASKAARDAAYALSKLYETVSPSASFLRTLLEILTRDHVTDQQHWDTVQDLVAVDIQMTACRSTTTLSSALHHALLAAASRRRPAPHQHITSGI